MIERLPAAPPAATLSVQPESARVADSVGFAAAYAERVHRFAAMVTRNDQDSADLAQEALLKALQALSRFDPAKGSQEAWVWRIVINTVKDAGRISTRRRLLGERWLREQIASASERSVEADVLDRLRDAERLAGVRRLPRRARTMIALRFGADLGTVDIARQLGMTPSGVSMAIGRGLSRLRHDLEDLR